MRQEARAVVQMARANERRNDEEKTNTTARRAKMVLADWQDWRRIKKPGQARGQRQEREEGRLAEGQAAQGFVRNLLFPARPSRRGGGWGGKSDPPSLRISPDYANGNFWKVLR